MTPKQMQYFMTVCNCGSVTKAADTLFVSRPVVSRVLHDLEEEFNTTLFIRTKTGLILTDQGNTLKKYIDGFTSSYDQLCKRMRGSTSPDAERSLRIGVSPTVIRWFFSDFYDPFHELHKDIRLFISELPALEIVDAIVNDEIDVGITPVRSNYTNPMGSLDSLNSLTLYESEIFLCASKNSSIAGAKEITHEEADKLPLILPHLPTVGIEYPYSNPIMSIAQMDVLQKVIESGELYSVLPYDVIDNWADVSLIPFTPKKTYQVCFYWNEMLPQNSAFKSILEFTKAKAMKE